LINGDGDDRYASCAVVGIMVEKIGLSVERLVGAEVRPSERKLVRLFFLNLFLLLTAYYILKVVREPLILMEGGAVVRSYARAVQALLLIALVPAYSLLANRVEPARLVVWINCFFVACLVLLALLSAAGIHVGFAFFVWLGIFSTMMIAQFWSLANDMLTEAEGRRLFPIVAAGGTVGGIFGSQIAARSIGPVGTYPLMLVAAALLGLCALLTRSSHHAALVYRQGLVRDEVTEARDTRGGYTLLITERYLLMIGLSVLLLNVINTTGDFVLAQMVSAHAKTAAIGAGDNGRLQQEIIGTFYGNFQTSVTTITALIQIFLVARVFKVFGVSRSVMFAPVFVAFSYGISALIPVLALVAVIKAAEDGAEYSLANTVRQALFLPTSRDAKYKAKTAIDTFIVRAGDLGSALLVAIGVYGGLVTREFAALNAVLGLVWIAVSWRIGRHYRKLSARVAAPGDIAADPPAA
jgi:ATP:ADP antiporter, AAA family